MSTLVYRHESEKSRSVTSTISGTSQWHLLLKHFLPYPYAHLSRVFLVESGNSGKCRFFARVSHTVSLHDSRIWVYLDRGVQPWDRLT